MDATQNPLVFIGTLLAVAGGFVLFAGSQCKGSLRRSCARRDRNAGDGPNEGSHKAIEGSELKKGKHKKSRTPVKAIQGFHEAPKRASEPQAAGHTNELFVDYVKGVNKPVDSVAIAPHAPLVASTTPDGKLHAALDGGSTYFLNFREDSFTAIDFWCKERQRENSTFLCGAMATSGRMVWFEITVDGKITGMKEIGRSTVPLQKGVVAELVASRAPWVITRSEGEDTEIRVHSYEGDFLAAVDTKQVHNLQLSVSGDGCLFGCAAWAPGVKIFEIKAKAGAFQKLEKAMDLRSSSGLVSFGISADRTRAAIIEKAGRLSLWGIDVRHQLGEDTKKICETTVQLQAQGRTTLHFSREGSVIIVATGNTLHFFHSTNLECYKSVENITPLPIDHMIVAPNNKFLVVCSVRTQADANTKP